MDNWQRAFIDSSFQILNYETDIEIEYEVAKGIANDLFNLENFSQYIQKIECEALIINKFKMMAAKPVQRASLKEKLEAFKCSNQKCQERRSRKSTRKKGGNDVGIKNFIAKAMIKSYNISRKVCIM